MTESRAVQMRQDTLYSAVTLDAAKRLLAGGGAWRLLVPAPKGGPQTDPDQIDPKRIAEQMALGPKGMAMALRNVRHSLAALAASLLVGPEINHYDLNAKGAPAPKELRALLWRRHHGFPIDEAFAR